MTRNRRYRHRNRPHWARSPLVSSIFLWSSYTVTYFWHIIMMQWSDILLWVDRRLSVELPHLSSFYDHCVLICRNKFFIHHHEKIFTLIFSLSSKFYDEWLFYTLSFGVQTYLIRLRYGSRQAIVWIWVRIVFALDFYYQCP